jgi:hypothetical protein
MQRIVGCVVSMCDSNNFITDSVLFFAFFDSTKLLVQEAAHGAI